MSELSREINIGHRIISEESPVFIMAEMSGNHLGSFDRALEIVHAAAEAGADCIKLQTYTPDSLTIDCDRECFRIQSSLWQGRTFYDLYREAATPYDWQPRLKEEAEKLGMLCFSSPFDFSGVDFMVEMGMPAIKIASYEIMDIPLIRKAASAGLPVVLSTGVAEPGDVELAVNTCLEQGNREIILLKCVSEYPTPYEDVHLEYMSFFREKFGCICGLSDHSPGSTIPLAAVALGAKMVEKHLTLERRDGGPDGDFSMEPAEFREMVKGIRNLEKALKPGTIRVEPGKINYLLTEEQKKERLEGRSLFAVKNITRGELFTSENVRSIRPAAGLHPKYYDSVLGKTAAGDIEFGTPLEMKHVLWEEG